MVSRSLACNVVALVHKRSLATSKLQINQSKLMSKRNVLWPSFRFAGCKALLNFLLFGWVARMLWLFFVEFCEMNADYMLTVPGNLTLCTVHGLNE